MAKTESIEPVYCSLDLELTGFDPAVDKILEIGFVFFDFHKGKLRILEEWSSLFNPERAIPSIVSGLTGIKQSEVDSAPLISEHLPFLQEKLREVVMVGHNINFDISFLESQGIVLSGKSIDTLEVAQVILPTRGSYNLESLMHHYGISHAKAHRALADAIASAQLLEAMYKTAAGFPEKLIQRLIKYGAVWDIEWLELIKFFKLEPIEHKRKEKIKKTKSFKLPTVKNSHFINLPGGKSITDYFDSATENERIHLVVADREKALAFWMKNPTIVPNFSPEVTFSPSKFRIFIKTSQEYIEKLFILKIWVWQETNWQSICLIDLNAHGNTGQLLPRISGGKIKNDTAGLTISDYSTFLSADYYKQLKGKTVYLENLHVFEEYLLKIQGKRVGWYSLAKGIKAIYNPETEIGLIKYKNEATEALASLDLFFALASLILKPKKLAQSFVLLNEIGPYEINKVKVAAEKLVKKLRKLPKVFRSKEFLHQAHNLVEYFNEKNNQNDVCWVEFGEFFPTFVQKPIEIAHYLKQMKRNTLKMYFVDQEISAQEAEYYSIRFGSAEDESNSLQKTKKLTYKIEEIKESKLISHLIESKLPAVVVLSTQSRVKSIYETSHSILKERGNLLAHGVTGGKNKVLRNFGISEKSILLASNSLLYQSGLSKIKVKTLYSNKYDQLQINNDPYKSQLLQRLRLANIDLVTIEELLYRRLLMSLIDQKYVQKIFLVVE